MGVLHMIMLTRVLQTSVEKYNVRWLDTIKVHNAWSNLEYDKYIYYYSYNKHTRLIV